MSLEAASRTVIITAEDTAKYFGKSAIAQKGSHMYLMTAEKALEYAGKIELLLMTATEAETLALVAALTPMPGHGEVAFTHIGNHSYRLGMLADFPVVHLQCLMGNRDAGSAMSATLDAASCWTPKAIVMVGIAWGSPRKGFALGDVLVAKSVQDYEQARVGLSYLFRNSGAQAGVKLLNRFINVGGWQQPLPGGRTSNRHDGLLLSGDKLLADAEFRDRLLDAFPEAIGGDMESYGLAQACRDRGLEWAVVKGICDWGDEHKEDSWQQEAARAAVSLCVAVFGHPSALHGFARMVPCTTTLTVPFEQGGECPNEIPAATDRFIAREPELAKLALGLKAPEKMALCLVVGMGGVGKSFLAAEAARRLLAEGAFPDGAIWFATYEQSYLQVMEHVIGVFGTPAASQEVSAIQAAYSRTMKSRRVLIVVDNALAASQITPLLTDSPNSAILVTSRNRMPYLKSRMTGSVELATMSGDEAVDLLLSKAGQLPDEQRPALYKVASLCGHLPLALSISGALLAEREMWPSVQSFAIRLEKHRLDCLAIDGSPDLDVRAVLHLGYEQMGDEQARVFRSLPLLGRASFGASAVSRMLGQDKDSTITCLAQLIGRSVLVRSVYGKYVMHDLLRELALELLTRDESEEQARWLQRRAEAYWDIWHEALKLDQKAAGYARKSNFDKALENYQKGQALSEEIDERQGIAFALGGIAAVWAHKGNADRAIEFYQKAINLSREIGDQKGEASTFGGLATAWAKKGDTGQAIYFYEKALELNIKIGDRKGEASTLGGIAATWAKTGDADKARRYYEMDRAICEEIGDLKGESAALGGIAAAWAKNGDFAKSLEFNDKGLAISDKIGDPKGTSYALAGIAAAWSQKGDANRAIEFYKKALVLNKEIGDSHGESYSLGGIAAAMMKKGDTDKAMEFYRQACRLNKENRDQKGEASSLGGIAAAWLRKGNADKALEFYDKASKLNHQINDAKGEASSLGGMAAAWAKKGDPDKAIEFYEQASLLNEQIDDKKGKASALGGIAGVWAHRGNFDKAIEIYQEGLALSKLIEDEKGEASALGGIASAWAKKGDCGQAISFYQQALDINERIGDRKGQASAMGGMGAAWAKSRDFDLAIDFYQKALVLNKAIGDPHGEASSSSGIAAVWAKKGNLDRAIEYYEIALGLRQKLHDCQGESYLLRLLAESWGKKGNLDQAIDRYNEALILYRHNRDEKGQAHVLSGLGSAWAKKGNVERSLEYNEQASVLNKRVGNRRGEAAALGGMVAAWAKKGDASKAIEIYERVKPIFKGLQDTNGEAHALGCLGTVCVRSGNRHKAIEYYKEALKANEASKNRQYAELTLTALRQLAASVGDESLLAFCNLRNKP